MKSDRRVYKKRLGSPWIQFAHASDGLLEPGMLFRITCYQSSRYVRYTRHSSDIQASAHDVIRIYLVFNFTTADVLVSLMVKKYTTTGFRIFGYSDWWEQFNDLQPIPEKSKNSRVSAP